MIDGIHHIAIVVRDIDAALSFYSDALGLEVAEQREVPEEGVKIAMLPTDEGAIELMRPLDGESGVGRFLERRGEGIHHVCLSVTDIDAAVSRLVAEGARLTADAPAEGPGGSRRIFVHPNSAHGVLIELYED
jgi:methylmalonyl-CoA/ethylmalonyl-CoA epimerase